MTLLPSLATGVVMLSVSLLSGRLATDDLAHRRAPGQVTVVAAPLAADTRGEPLWRRYVITGPGQILPRPPARSRT